MKIRFIIILLFCCGLLAGSESFSTFLAELLHENGDYQKVLAKNEQDIARYYLNRSISLPELNVIYQNDSNDILRDELKTTTFTEQENTTISENDERWQIELSKQFFPKDFDNADDEIGNAIDLMTNRADLMIAKDQILEKMFDDMIDMFEANKMIGIISAKVAVLIQENAILVTLENQNIIEPAELIENLEELETEEKKLQEYRETYDTLHLQYGNINEEFIRLFTGYMVKETSADTLSFDARIADQINSITKSGSKISRKIKKNRMLCWLPELTTSVSYNWRNIDQDWDITKTGVEEFWDREQTEEFPELKLELSLPLDFAGNLKSKSHLLRAYEHELGQSKQELAADIKKLQKKRHNALQNYQLRLERKQQLLRLRAKQAQSVEDKFIAEPSLLGDLPQIEREVAILKVTKAETELNVTKMKLFKEIYLINNFGVNR
ncbi:MAG: hypothetical protein K9N06_01460 [Candidatus Cloacimonetes bacterium]|nr:hypothetical protein [Candidatus Cloacimonadota bacterium]